MPKFIRYHCMNPDCSVKGGAYFEGGIELECPICKSQDIMVVKDSRRFAS